MSNVLENIGQEPSTANSGTAIKPTTKPNVSALNQPMSLIKQMTINNLLSKVTQVNYEETCKNLGWLQGTNKDDSPKNPAQKHYKVAIIDQLLKVAKANDWHLVGDAGLSYIYMGCMWLSLDKDELKNLLKDVAIRQGYPEIEARDSRFINLLYEQSLQDGFFADKYFEKQSMINLSNCTLVLVVCQCCIDE